MRLKISQCNKASGSSGGGKFFCARWNSSQVEAVDKAVPWSGLPLPQKSRLTEPARAGASKGTGPRFCARPHDNSQRVAQRLGSPPQPCGRAACNGKSTIVLVNDGRVNAGSSYFLPATFCVIFCDSGRILDSQNPVKYSGNSPVNQKSARSWLPGVINTDEYQYVARPSPAPPRLKSSVTRICYIRVKVEIDCSHRKRRRTLRDGKPPAIFSNSTAKAACGTFALFRHRAGRSGGCARSLLR